MKKLLLNTLPWAITILCLASIPWSQGIQQYKEANRVIEYLSSRPENDCSDACIEDVLHYYGFDIGWEETPTFKQYYSVGWSWIFSSSTLVVRPTYTIVSRLDDTLIVDGEWCREYIVTDNQYPWESDTISILKSEEFIKGEKLLK